MNVLLDMDLLDYYSDKSLESMYCELTKIDARLRRFKSITIGGIGDTEANTIKRYVADIIAARKCGLAERINQEDVPEE